MARSKRQRKYSFTVNQKKTVQWKQELADKLREQIQHYDRLIVFRFINPRTDLIQDLRKKYRKSKFFMGKNRVLQIALGRSVEEEIDENLHLVSEQLIGQRGILFTNEKVDDLIEFFSSHRVAVHSRPSNLAPFSLTLQPGILEGFTHNQEPFLRKLGLVTRLKVQNAGTGIPELLVPYTVCKKGKRLTANQATLLRLLGYKNAEFRVHLYCVWERQNGAFTAISTKNKIMKLAASDDDDDDDGDVTSDDGISEDEEEVETLDDEDMEE
ncbi:Ribosomal protein L10P [Trinorchestia longiramus]|nr:Ribosomal protein L10P [Trinorchestia longiramus]